MRKFILILGCTYRHELRDQLRHKYVINVAQITQIQEASGVVKITTTDGESVYTDWPFDKVMRALDITIR